MSSHYGQSLGQEAWQRLKAHRLAMISLFTIVVITLSCTFAPLLSSIPPEKQASWFHTQAPFSSRPDVENTNEWIINQPTSKIFSPYKQLIIEENNQDYEEVRIVLRKGKVFRIQKVEGALPLENLKIDHPQHKTFEVLRSGELGRELNQIEIHLNQEAPKDLFQKGYKVAFLRTFKSHQITSTYTIHLDKGIVKSIQHNEKNLNALKLSGEQITSLLADGKLSEVTHYLGTDELGRDLFTRILYGGQISLLVGVVATLVSLIIGVIVGAISGYIGGRIDRLIMSGVDILYAIPFMFLVILLLVNFGRSILMLFIALGAVQWLTMSRIIRTQIMSLKQLTFVDAAKLSGANSFQIIFYHLLPNCLSNILIYSTLTIPMVIMEESFLSFIGLGMQFGGKSLDSWGTLVHQGMSALGSNGENAWLLIFPSLTMAATLLGLNILGDGLRDAFDPKLRGKD